MRSQGDSETWICLERSGSVCVVTLNAPKQLNSIHAEMMTELIGVLEDVQADSSCRALVIAANGRAFCTGAHVGEMAGFEDKGREIALLLDQGWNRVVRLIRDMPKPVIAAVQGIAAGGGVGLALAADVVLAARSAQFIQVFGPKLGVVPDVGSTWFVPRAIGRARAMSLMLTGKPLDAETAEAWGLIAHCVDDDALIEETMALARQLADGPVAAFAEIRAAVDRSLVSDLGGQLDYERDTNGRLCAGADFTEGTSAFVEKRSPKFTGHKP
ncbi:enoyl-CoA hydratase-related protein [Roseibium sp.]|uniref:enoyl-CoA hydratase-related protein n=1 Tax=Roseibium sp. TaxID=1936156 RepID=UPI003A97D47F